MYIHPPIHPSIHPFIQACKHACTDCIAHSVQYSLIQHHIIPFPPAQSFWTSQTLRPKRSKSVSAKPRRSPAPRKRIRQEWAFSAFRI